MTQNKRSLPRVLCLVFTCALILLTSFLLAEFALRVYEKVTKSIPISYSLKTLIHERYGWRGALYGLSDETRADDAFTLMVLGDSYTDGEKLQPYALYFSTIRAYTDANVFAYGGTGFGTLQEYLVFQDYKDMIQPDLVLLQVSANDFSDNSLRLSRLQGGESTVFFRPFWVDGEVKNYFMKPLGPIMLYSRLLYRFQHLLDLYEYHHRKERAADAAELAAAREEAIAITDEIIGKLKQEAGDIPIVAFISYGSDADIQAFDRIFRHHGIPFISNVPAFFDLLQSETDTDMSLGPGKGHWNGAANVFIGKLLTERLVELGLLENKGPFKLQDMQNKLNEYAKEDINSRL